MSLGRYKDLCIDALHPHALAAFWAGALGREVELLADGDAVLRGPTPEHTVWINAVPETKVVKHRLHLDVHTRSVADLIAAGATVIDDTTFPWAVMADPEGGEFCAFTRTEERDELLYELILDCAEPERVARWWADLVDGTLSCDDEHGWWALEAIPGAPFECVVFVPIPEEKSVKNRLHIDITTPDVTSILASGAALVRSPDDPSDWSVLADPEGNEFCAFTMQPS